MVELVDVAEKIEGNVWAWVGTTPGTDDWLDLRGFGKDADSSEAAPPEPDLGLSGL